MRVLVVTPWFPSLKSPGEGIFNLRDIEMLGLDHAVTVLHLTAPGSNRGERVRVELDESRATNPKVHRIPYVAGDRSLSRAAVSSIRAAAADADLVHTMAFGALRPVAKARLRIPWVHTEHWSALTVPLEGFRARAVATIARRWFRLPHVVVAVGEQLAKAVAPSRSGPILVIGNHVRFAKRGRLPIAPEQRGAGPLRMIGVGGLVPWKGPLEAVEAVAALAERGIVAELEWAGTGALAEAVLATADRLGVGERVRLLGHLAPEALSEALLRSHAFLLPTAGETFGVAIAEALGHGLPVVTSGTGGHHAFLRTENSRIVMDRTGESLAEATVELVADRNRWAPERIADDARERFSEEVRRASYANVYGSAGRMAHA